MAVSLPVVVVLLLLAATDTDAFSSYNDDLLDARGSPVRPGVEYYIVPVGGGGVKSTTLSAGSSCPAYVGQESYEADYGTPVVLKSVNNPEAAHITADERVVVQFARAETCVWSPTVWTVEESNGERLLVTGGDPPKFPPPAGIGNNMFMFSKTEADTSEVAYSLSYCRCNLCAQACDAVGRTSVNGRGILNVKKSGEGSGFGVVLVKVGEESEHLKSLAAGEVPED